MSIALITDGWLYPIVTIPALRAPDDIEAYSDPIPVTPCAATATDPALDPPHAPILTEASGPNVPVPPCGITGIDPTIDPPGVPTAPEASEDADNTAPSVPKCPQGNET
jgi:hypothetical protein